MKIKINPIKTILLVSSVVFLASCYTIPSSLTLGTVSPFGAEKTSSGSSNIGIPMNNPNAKKFADAVVNMKVGSSTQGDAIASLGRPSTKSKIGGGESWGYALNTGAMPAIGTLYFQGGTMIGVEVIQTTMTDGTFSTETVYKKGEKLSD